jgi:pSer/pThr/pTyr-binding forkhead associated (FHA) protein
MFDFTRFSLKTPKSRLPEEKNEYSLAASLKAKPIVLDKKKKFTIGRASKNNLVLKEGTISEVHATLKWDKSSFKIKDERSTNGTYLNNKRIIGVTMLKNGDKIKIGKYVLVFGVKKIREKKDETPVKRIAKKPAAAKKKTKAPAAKKKSAPLKKSTKKPVARKKAFSPQWTAFNKPLSAKKTSGRK